MAAPGSGDAAVVPEEYGIPGAAIQSGIRKACRIAALAVALVGASVLAGWFLDIAILKSVAPGLATMKANTAIALFLSGLCAGLLFPWRHSVSRPAASAAAGLVLLIGGLSWIEYLYGVDLGIDELIIRDPESGLFPGRMAPMTALCFMVTGVALLGTAWKLRVLAQAASLLLLALSLVPMLGYTYEVAALYRVHPYGSMALHTAASFQLLGLSLVFYDPGYGISRLFLSPMAGGQMVRRLLPLILATIFILGWICVWASKLGWVDPLFAIALLAVLCIIFCTGVVIWHAFILCRVDKLRARKEAEVRELNESLERKVTERTRQLQDSLDHVKRLQSLLPVCAWCKKVRDDKNYWQTLEEYLTEHTDTRVTHGICPECLLSTHESLASPASGGARKPGN